MPRKRSLGAAFWVAILAVFATLAGPVRSVQAHALMTGPPAHSEAAHARPMSMAMAMPMGADAPAAAAPCHHEGDSPCARACFVGGQCLAARLERLPEPARRTSLAAYRQPIASFGGVYTEPGEPPPR